jgi:protein-tyrosine phosphatase
MQKTIDMRDALDYPIHVHFDETNRWIEQMRQQKLNVLVHCHAGVSRSVAIVCAYLMKKNQWGMKQALTYVKGKRKRAKPNQHFIN